MLGPNRGTCELVKVTAEWKDDKLAKPMVNQAVGDPARGFHTVWIGIRMRHCHKVFE